MSGPPFDWSSEAEHPWLWDFDSETLDWPWPASVYEACPMGCDRGSVFWGSGLQMECPACGGSGVGKPHSC